MSGSLALMDLAIAHINANPDLADFGPPVSMNAIEQAKEMLGVPLSQTYVKFLREFGVGDFNGAEIYGIVESNIAGSSVPSVVWINRDLRKGQNWPRKYLVIASTGDGGWYCLDTSDETESGEFPLILCDPYANLIKVIHPSFANYFLEITRVT